MEVSRQYLGQHQLIQIISSVDPEWRDFKTTDSSISVKSSDMYALYGRSTTLAPEGV
jgi:hypothetical protein